MKKQLSMIVLASTALLGGCMATTSGGGGSVGEYAIGDDSTVIKKGRNRASAQLSRAELEQHRRQRTNVSEELDLEAKKRRMQRDELHDNMGTAGSAINLIRSLRRW
ncbi:MAG: hypothetical protein Q4A28_00480 [Brachymonas sp.]|nr:hypothetical protein [Brachymonas sp.]